MSKSANIEKISPTFCTTSANVLNQSSSSVDTNNESSEICSSQDKKILSILVDLPINVNINRSMCISSEDIGHQNTTCKKKLQDIFVRTLFLI